ncbi:MAG: hypothetical protein DYG89_38225 [Caldilinea sp. CFX5]|nr:hypothetical protein [Caldilinea sp. CFX5]
MLKARPTVALGKGLPALEKPWRRWLTNHEQHFLTDNQLSLFVDPKHPGCERIHFYPLPFPHHFADGWDFAELVNHDSVRSTGPNLALTADETTLTFQPHQIVKQMRIGAATVQERTAVAGNTLVIRWTTEELPSATLRFTLPYFAATVAPIDDGLLAVIDAELYVALVVRGADAISVSTENAPFSCSATLTLAPQSELVLSLCCGYARTDVVASAQAAARQPDQIFSAAEATWDDYFRQVVPFFACSDTALEQLYYYQAYVTRANLYDIPYEPFTHPYTCPWKTGAVWQWSWNTPMNAICERWLNDKQLGAGGILLQAANRGGLNIGTYLHPTRKMTTMRGHDEAMQAVGAFRQQCPPDLDLALYTTIPHTAPNGLLGAWEFYLTWGDPLFLRQMLQVMVAAEEAFSRHELPSGLYACSFVDEFDYSLRLKPFIAGFRKGDPEMMLKMDTPFVAVDYNCYLHALRERMLAAAALLPASGVDADALIAKNARLKAAINQFLWDPADGFYYDLDPRTMQRSGVKCIAGFAALYAGLADRAQADRLVAHLTNPMTFGAPYPCPSVALDTPDLDPSLPTYGGDCLVTSGIWFTMEGLVRYGFPSLAADYLRKTLQMMTLDGPSSSYSYHAVTGKYNQPKHTLAAQSAIVTDLICKYVVGLSPRPGGALEVAPLLLDGIEQLTFGPYHYCGKWVTVNWTQASGYDLHVAAMP